jgi:hypothetical protein
MRGNEFAHVHPPDDGSMHMMLPAGDVPDLNHKGWGEIHPLVPAGRMPLAWCWSSDRATTTSWLSSWG